MSETATPAPAPKRKRGAKPKLTPEVQALITEKIAAVATLRDAALMAGVDESTVYAWLRKGQVQKRGIYRQFSQAIELAKAQRRSGLKAQIRVHGRHDWRAAAALGAITDPEEFVPQLKVHVTSEIDGVLDALAETFKDKPELYEQALQAVVAHRAARSKLEDPAAEE